MSNDDAPLFWLITAKRREIIGETGTGWIFQSLSNAFRSPELLNEIKSRLFLSYQRGVTQFSFESHPKKKKSHPIKIVNLHVVLQMQILHQGADNKQLFSI